jgi:glycine C-acetyltransferase
VRTRAAAEYYRYYSATHTFSNALSPVQAATVLRAFDIVRSDEGKMLRRKLMENILLLRSEMTAAGLETLGDPSPIVPVRVGTEALGRFAARRLADGGGIANLVEYPAVPQGNARFRFQVMAAHTTDDVKQVVAILARAIREADIEMRVAHEGDKGRVMAGASAVEKAA